MSTTLSRRFLSFEEPKHMPPSQRHGRRGLRFVAGLILAVFSAAGLSAPPPAPVERDVVVYGGSSAGVIAAVQAARMGKSVVLVSPDRRLGGLSSGGLGMTDTGNKHVIGGLAREFYHRVWRHYEQPEAWRWQERSAYGNRGQGTPAIDGAARTMWIFEPHVAEQIFAALVAEHGIEVVRDEWLDREGGVRKSGPRIESITTLSGRTYAGKMFIDATYEGDLMAAAGAAYHVGREANDVYGEEHNGVQVGVLHHRHHFGAVAAPMSPYRIPGDPTSGLLPRISADPPGAFGTGDHRVQAYCFRTCLTNVPANRVPFPKPAGYDAGEYELLLRIFDAGWREFFRKFDPIPNAKTDTNNHGPFSFDNIGFNYDYPEAGYERRREIIAEHRTYQQGLLWFVANDPRVPADVREELAAWGLAADEFADNGHWPHQLYVREARRMVGSFVMTEGELRKQRPTPEPVGMGSYTIDSHNVQRYVTPEGFVQNEGDIGVSTKGPYGIAYGSLVPKRGECDNLLVPVCVSASHIAYGSIRMEPVFMILGQSAATAASLAIDGGLTVQDVPYSRLEQRLLADGQVLAAPEPAPKPKAKKPKQPKPSAADPSPATPQPPATKPVQPAAPAAAAPVIRWTADREANGRPRILGGVRTTELFHATPETGTFSLHGHLARFGGTVFACWDSQARDENAPGQHGVYRFTTDGGETWSPPAVLFPPLVENVPLAEAQARGPFQTSQGFAEIDGRLYAVTCVDKTLPEKVHRFNEVSRARVGFLAREVHADGTLGEIFWLATEPPPPEPGFPAYPAGDPAVVARIEAHFRQPANLPQLLFGPREHPDSADGHRMTEPTQPWRLADGTWARLYRDQGDAAATSRREIEASKRRRFYAAFSHDDGATWTAPLPTDVPDSCARANTDRLPDGQVYLIHNPLPLAPKQGGRAILSISLSRDGLHFDRTAVLRSDPPPRRHEGKAKSIGYQYPHSLVVGDSLWVIYAVNKEDIELARIPLTQLAAAAVRPNVLFIAADDLRTDLGCYGDPLVKTPNLDRLAARGTLFLAAYCQQALCNPSRASLLTGRRPDTLAIWDLPTHFRTRHPELVTLPQCFKEQGYHAENIGKIFHNWRQRIQGDPASWSVPAVMHFDSHAHDTPVVEGPPPPELADTPRCEMRDVPDEAYFDGRIATRAVQALRQAADRPEPFFLAVGFWKPHAPFNAPKRYWDLYDPAAIPPPEHPEWPQDAPRIAWHDSNEILREAPGGLSAAQARTIRHGYLAATSYLDAQIGRVLDELERLGLAGSTIVVLWSDHGFHLGEHELWAKTSNFELDARVPLVIAAPGVAGGGRVTTPVELLDLYPTLVELAGLPRPAGLEGQSLVPLLRDPAAEFKPAAVTQHPRPAYYNRGSGGGSGSGSAGVPDAMGYSVRTPSHRYTEWRDWQTGQTLARELYDHAADPGESVNLAGRPESRDAVARHAALLESFSPLVRPGWTPVLP